MKDVNESARTSSNYMSSLRDPSFESLQVEESKKHIEEEDEEKDLTNKIE